MKTNKLVSLKKVKKKKNDVITQTRSILYLTSFVVNVNIFYSDFTITIVLKSQQYYEKIPMNDNWPKTTLLIPPKGSSPMKQCTEPKGRPRDH